MTYIGTNEVIRRSRVAAARALNKAAADVRAHSLQRTPMREGDLRASARIDEANVERLRAEVSYNTPYAAAQHEGVVFYEKDGRIVHWVARHWTVPGTGPKYLEGEFLALIPHLENYFIFELRRMF